MAVRTYPFEEGTWVVADGGVWLDGIYESEATARRAATLSDSVLSALGRIYRIDGENRPVTMADLQPLID